MVTLLEQAQALLNTDSLSIDDVRELQRLEAQASGDEAELIAELWEAVYALADESLLKNYRMTLSNGGKLRCYYASGNKGCVFHTSKSL